MTTFVQTSGSRFRVNGQELRFIGANIRGLLHYGDPNLLPASHERDAASLQNEQ